MPTKDQDEASIASLIELHYEKTGISKGWSRKRFNELLQLTNCLPAEIGALCCVKPALVKKYMRDDRFPPTVSLHLAIIEAVILEIRCGKPWQPIVPLHLLKDKIPGRVTKPPGPD